MTAYASPEERVWQYLLKNRTASAEETAFNADTTVEFVNECIGRISSPNWREEVWPTPKEGLKFDADKPRYDLIPPEIEEAIAKVLTFGAKKYSLEVLNEWHALLYAPSVVEVRVTTPTGSVVAVTKNTSDSPIPNMQSANVKIVETGKPETLIASSTWQRAEKMIRQHVQGTSGPSGSERSRDTGLPKTAMRNSVPLAAPYAAQESTCTLTIATEQGDFAVSFAPGAITDSAFWTTVWRDLNAHYGISKPQSKTGERNWELGMKWGRPYGAMRRHMAAWWSGEDTDPETGMSHLWHAACCIAFLTAFEARGVGTDDRPKDKTNA